MAADKNTRKTPRNDNKAGAYPSPSPAYPAELGKAMMDVYETLQPLIQEMLERYRQQNTSHAAADPLNLSSAYADFLYNYWKNPFQHIEKQSDYWQKSMQIWQSSASRFWGGAASPIMTPRSHDRRFSAPEWSENPLFDAIKQLYLLNGNYLADIVESTQGLSPSKREKLAFSTRLLTEALSPTNFLLTNPDAIRETLKTGGQNLVRGLENLAEDLKQSKDGNLRVSTTNPEAFELGKNIAATPGRVVYQNDMIQLIQYEPQTEEVFARPLLIVPPWINKYYILDLREGNSFIEWAVRQGHTVFSISWVNPDAKLAHKTFEDYMQEGVISALDQIRDITGEPDCNAVGYCLGGTLLTVTLAFLAAKKQSKRVASATFLTTLVDFENSGEMKIFMDDEQLSSMEKSMEKHGVLRGKQLQQTFSLLRANDLIWSFVVNNYLMGKEPFPFDLLYWNDDSSNIPAATHRFCLRKFYRDNLLRKPGGITISGTPINVGTIKTPAYFLSTREDHIAPWRATYEGTQLLSGPKQFTLAASGHIAGVINSPEKNKYCYWSAESTPDRPEQWLENATQKNGSWWPHWQSWAETYGGKKVSARKPARGIEAAPGTYAKVRSH
ncbi:MAG: class I poly(R)-hydroxyalkanoic acid synthase [Alphaproteobacteria bacterium]|nr:class I poly(R)-hydroxyalkanoic acid synthase [Alphaproteobacteria bacterium]